MACHFLQEICQILVSLWPQLLNALRKGSSNGLILLLDPSRKSRRSWLLPQSFAFLFLEGIWGDLWRLPRKHRWCVKSRKSSYHFLHEKLNKAKQRYDVYDRELYAVEQSLRYWHRYLLPVEFVLHSYHQALCYINSQKRVEHRHIKLLEFIQEYTLVLKHPPVWITRLLMFWVRDFARFRH